MLHADARLVVASRWLFGLATDLACASYLPMHVLRLSCVNTGMLQSRALLLLLLRLTRIASFSSVAHASAQMDLRAAASIRAFQRILVPQTGNSVGHYSCKLLRSDRQSS
jgi:hypothetical protein